MTVLVAVSLDGETLFNSLDRNAYNELLDKYFDGYNLFFSVNAVTLQQDNNGKPQQENYMICAYKTKNELSNGFNKILG